MAENKKQLLADKLFRFSLVFLVVYLLLSFLVPKPEQNTTANGSGVTIKSIDKNYAQGQLVTFEVKNDTQENISGMITVEERDNGEWRAQTLENNTVEVATNEKTSISFSEQNTTTFTDLAKYRVVLKDRNGEFLAENEFEVSEAGIFRSIWRTLFFKPIYNLLIICLEIGQNYLFAAVIILTIIIKTILLVPSKKAILAQQKMQKVQPEIEKLKKKYKTDPQKQAQEMMGLWKKHKVNPGAALVPTLIQFPVLIALFFVIKDGLMPHNLFLMYPLPFLENFSFANINFNFLWMQLNEIDPYFLLPISIGLLQFWQMKSMQAKRKKKAGDKAAEASPQETMMNVMMYALPAIVVVFSATLPSAVGLYWGTSTVFAIAQQRLLKKDMNDSTPTGKKDDDNIVDVEIVEEKAPKKTRTKA